MKNPYYVLSGDKRTNTTITVDQIKTAVFVNLFYEEQVAYYQTYLEKIPRFIDVYIISSKQNILDMYKSSGYRTILKDNRGRDISALLVAAAPFITQYEYICFIHDKKEKTEENKSYTEFWVQNLWENMLGSEIYICNILELFESDKQLGLLAPLPPHKDDKGIWLDGAWGLNFENTKQLAKELNLHVPVLQENPPYVFSTVFWARTNCLSKLFSKNWKYVDFPPEPIRNDGELNHAIERILQYVVEDGGFESKIVINSVFASIFIQEMHDELWYLWRTLKNNFSIDTCTSFEKYTGRIKKIREFEKKYDAIYLYGAGKRGRECLAMCEILDLKPEGIVVTNTLENSKTVNQIPVISIDNIAKKQKAGIVVTVGKAYEKEITEELDKRGITDYMIY